MNNKRIVKTLGFPLKKKHSKHFSIFCESNYYRVNSVEVCETVEAFFIGREFTPSYRSFRLQVIKVLQYYLSLEMLKKTRTLLISKFETLLRKKKLISCRKKIVPADVINEQSETVALPLAYALLSSKEEIQYEAVFYALISAADEYGIEDFHPQTIMSGFEKAIINAVFSTFPEVDVNLCYFHLKQSAYRLSTHPRIGAVNSS